MNAVACHPAPSGEIFRNNPNSLADSRWLRKNVWRRLGAKLAPFFWMPQLDLDSNTKLAVTVKVFTDLQSKTNKSHVQKNFLQSICSAFHDF